MKSTEVFKNKSELITQSSGVYGIKNHKSGKIYIGSCNCLRRRYYEHASYLRNGKHWILDLQLDWNNLGLENFEFIVIEECSNYEEREDFYLNIYKNSRYNLAEHVNCKGFKHSEETKEKIRIARKKQVIPKEAYEKRTSQILRKNPNYYREIATKHSKPFKCNETGHIFKTCKEAAEFFNSSHRIIYRLLTKTSLKSRYLNFTFDYV